MKRQILISILSLLILVGCKKLDKLTQFNIDYNSEITIPSGIGINLPFAISTPDMQTNSEASFSENNTRKDLIESVKLTECTLSILSPSGQNFDFIKTIKIYISADGLNEVLVASKVNMANGQGNSITLDLEDQDLQAYIKKDSFKVKSEVVTDEVVSNDITVDIYTRFFVDAKILGL